ncbi:hypothetical protein STEG23_023325 [Scotinomys teguina]
MDINRPQVSSQTMDINRPQVSSQTMEINRPQVSSQTMDINRPQVSSQTMDINRPQVSSQTMDINRPQVSSQTMDINRPQVSSQTMDINRPQVSSQTMDINRPQVSSQTMDINRPQVSSQTMDINMASGVLTDHGYQHGLRCPHRSWISTWPQVSSQTMDINMASGVLTDHGYQHGLSLIIDYNQGLMSVRVAKDLLYQKQKETERRKYCITFVHCVKMYCYDWCNEKLTGQWLDRREELIFSVQKDYSTTAVISRERKEEEDYASKMPGDTERVGHPVQSTGKLEGRAFFYGFSVHSTGLETAHMRLFFKAVCR